MSFASFISTIGNNSSVLPIVFKDGIESTFKTGLAYKQGSKVSKKEGFYEARETAIEEFGTAGIWFATPILVGKIFNGAMKKKYGLSSKELLEAPRSLLKGKHYQKIEDNIKNLADSTIQADFKTLDKEKLLKLGYIRSTLSVISAVGLIAGLTKFKQNLTKKSLEQSNNGNEKKTSKKGGKPAFKGEDSLVEPLLIDGGLSAIRIGTARSKSERIEYIFKQITFILVAYFGGGVIEKMLNKIAQICKLPLGLDAKVLADKDFIKKASDACKNEVKKSEFLKFVDIEKNASNLKKEEKVIKFIDKELKTGFNKGKFQNQTLEAARQSGIISIKNNKRDACKFVDVDAVIKTNDHLKTFVNTASQKTDSGKFIKNVKFAKYASVLSNVALCSVILGVVLPKIQYLFREKMIGSVASPGIKAANKDEAV